MKHVTHYKSSPSGKKGGSFSLTGRLKGGVKFLLLTFMLCLASGAWADVLEGQGTEANPYLIRNATDWGEFCSNTSNYHDCTVKLTNSISITIAQKLQSAFYGVFDGGYHTITVGPVEPECKTAYIFGALQKDPTGIQSPTLTIRNVHFKTAQGVSLTGSSNTGLVQATNAPENELCFENVTNSMSIQCSEGIFDNYAGAFVGACNSHVTFRSCVFDGTISTTGNPIVGGFACVNRGDVSVTMEYCAMAGNITGTTTNRALIIRTAGKTNPITANHCCYIPRVDTEHIIGNNTWEAACTATGFRSISEYADGTMCAIVGCHPYPNGGNCVHCTEYGTEKTVYSIATLADWATFRSSPNQYNKYQLVRDFTEEDGTDNRITTVVANASGNEFQRIFDGLEHRVTLNLNTTNDLDNRSLFGVIGVRNSNQNEQSGTVRNLIVDGTITSNNHYNGSIARVLNANSIIEKCVSKVDINCTYTTEHAIVTGGIVGCMYDQCIVRNCAFYGSITGLSTSNSACGIVAWEAGDDEDSKPTVQNCFVDAKAFNTGSYSQVINYGAGAKFNNNYYTNYKNTRTDNARSTVSSPWDALWGFTCYHLNGGNTTNPVWYQDLSQNWKDGSQEWRPMPFYKYGATVYKTLKAGTTAYAYTNSSEGRTLTVIDGYCQIGSTQDMMDFANCVNGMGKGLKAKLTADVSVDMKESGCGQNKWFSLACHNDEGHRFTGEIDGQGHTLEVYLPYNYANTSNFGLINNVAETGASIEAGARIKNIKLLGSIGNEDGYRYDGTTEKYSNLGIVGRSDGNLTFHNVTNSLDIMGGISGIAGFVGYFAGITDNDATKGNSRLTFTNCLFDGSVKSNDADPAGFVGWVKDGNTVVAKNLLNTGNITPKSGGKTSAFFKYTDGTLKDLTCSNLYYKNDFNWVKPATANQVTDAQLKSGEVCWKLGSEPGDNRGGSTGVDKVWRQDLHAGSPETTPRIVWNMSESEKGNIVYESTVKFTPTLGIATYVPHLTPLEKFAGVDVQEVYDVNNSALQMRSYPITAYKPVILKKQSADRTAITQYGNLEPQNGTDCQLGLLIGVTQDEVGEGERVPTGAYVLQVQGNRERFFHAVAGKEPLKGAWKAYLQLSTQSGIEAFYFDEAETSIEDMMFNNASNNYPIYTLSGQRISKMQRGVNVVNGKKVLK